VLPFYNLLIFKILGDEHKSGGVVEDKRTFCPVPANGGEEDWVQ
jgi:hypothetical protein